MSDIDISEAGIENIYDAIPTNGRGTNLWWFQFGAYGDTHVFVWGGSAYRALDDALEEAAGWLADNAPEIFHEVESEEDEVDMTYTESGWIPSWEWHVNELHPGDELYAEVWEATIDQLVEEDILDEDDVERVNKFAEKYGIDAEWKMDDEVENPSNDEGDIIGGEYHEGPMQRDEEHGQEWLTCVGCGAQWSIVDTNRGEDYEQVSEGDGSCEDND